MKSSTLFKLRFHPTPLWIIFEVNFLKSFSIALLSVVLPLYFKTFIESNSGIGFVYLLGYIASFVASLFSGRIIATLHKRKTLLLALIGFITCFGLFVIIKHTVTMLAIFALFHFMLALFIVDVGLYVKHYSSYRSIAANEGKLGSLGNIGWLVGPLLGSLIADRFGYEATFLFAGASSTLALISFFFVRLAKEEGRIVVHEFSFLKNVKNYFSDKNLRRTYINNAGLGFIYSIWDYLPLLMSQLGASLPVIGMTRTLMGVPQTLFEYPLGRLADEETGERKLFIVGYFLAALFTALLGVYTDLRLFIISFFLAAVGTSMLEMTRDSYFFRQVKEHEVAKISVYRTSDTIFFIVGQVFAITLTSFAPLPWLFVFGGMTILGCALNAFQLKNLRS